MRSRRTLKRGGVGLSDVTNFFTGKNPEPLLQTESEVPEPLLQTESEVPEPLLQPESEVPNSAPGSEMDVQVPELMPKPEPRTMNEALKEISGLTGYHMRSIINAISLCNSTMKMQNNAAGVGNSVLNAFGRGNEAKIEMNECGSQCEARSNKVKDALTKLLILSEGNNALGFIASKTGAVNSATYIGNSTVSLANRGANTVSEVGSAVANQATQAASAVSGVANQASQAASNAANSVGSFFSGLTRRATQPAKGGRRRTRRR